VRLEMGIVPFVPAPIVAKVSRSPRQAQLRHLLRGCEVVPPDEPGSHRVGALVGSAGTSDIADAALVHLAMTLGADIVTSDRRDIEELMSKLHRPLRILDV